MHSHNNRHIGLENLGVQKGLLAVISWQLCRNWRYLIEFSPPLKFYVMKDRRWKYWIIRMCLGIDLRCALGSLLFQTRLAWELGWFLHQPSNYVITDNVGFDIIPALKKFVLTVLVKFCLNMDNCKFSLILTHHDWISTLISASCSCLRSNFLNPVPGK